MAERRRWPLLADQNGYAHGLEATRSVAGLRLRPARESAAACHGWRLFKPLPPGGGIHLCDRLGQCDLEGPSDHLSTAVLIRARNACCPPPVVWTVQRRHPSVREGAAG